VACHFLPGVGSDAVFIWPERLLLAELGLCPVLVWLESIFEVSLDKKPSLLNWGHLVESYTPCICDLDC